MRCRIEEITNPGDTARRHREMVQLWHNLDIAGKSTGRRVPRDPHASALLRDYRDGYLTDLPAWARRAVPDGPAPSAVRFGYRRRWSPTRADAR
ncbi:hypothetical protein [Nocardia brasiliensis]|uniref:hypothetical protein n=1 Tax=Nocardia brasiliensis TaxID=37326 RepID=UPI000AC3B679|nr:hypothetical protein [Nocardia brasiliensis]